MKTQLLSTILALGALANATSDHRDLNTDVWTKALESLHKREIITTWSPPSNLAKGLDEVWANTIKKVPDFLNNKNHGLDVLVAGKGKLNYCVRWDSTQPVTAAQRAAIKASLQSNLPKWTDKLSGFMGFPYDKIEVDVVGWAVRDKSLLQGDTSDIQVYTNRDVEGAPECDPACGRPFHLDNNYSKCAAGASRHYDTSLFLKAGMGNTGFGGPDYQQVGSEYFLANLAAPHIFLHEFGHFLSLDDFYDWTPSGVTNFIMKAGSSLTITDFDAWMVRDWWRHLSAQPGRYNLSPSKPTTTTKPAAPVSTTLIRSTTKASATPAPSVTPAPTPGTVPKYGQCGGSGWTGPTACVAGSTCTKQNDWYSQCL